jgi:hypothetical protein
VKVSPLLAAPESPPLSSFQLNLNMAALGVNEIYNQGQRLRADLEGEYSRDLGYSFKVKARGGFRAEVGNSRAIYTDIYTPQQVPRLKEAWIEWAPATEVAIRIGALDQEDLRIYEMLFEESFLAARESFRFTFNHFFIGLYGQQAVPNSPSSVVGRPTGSTEFPFFFIERLSLGFENQNNFVVETHVSHFSFENLPADVADTSRYLGNTVSGILNTNSQFVYNFSGYEAGFILEARLNSWFYPKLSASGIINLEAPEETAKSFLASISNTFELGPNFRLTPQFLMFALGADASPALYTPNDWGHNNREGFGISVVAELVRDRIDFGAQAINAKLISANAFQGDWESFSVFFRSRYDLL